MKKMPLVAKSFRLHAESVEELNAMPDRNNWVRDVIKTALKQQKAA